MSITATTTPAYTPPTIESEVEKFYGRTMDRLERLSFSAAFDYFFNITRTNLRDQNAVQMLLDRLPSEFGSKYKQAVEEHNQKAQEAKAKAEAEAKARAEANAKHQKDLDTFWANNPPDVLTVEELENIDLTDEEELFAILARYRIARIEYTFRPEYHWDQFLNVGDHDTYFWLSDDLQMNQSSYSFQDDELPEDEDGKIKDTLKDAIHTIAEEIASDFASNHKIDTEYDGGTVTFDIAARKITVSAECETTKTFTKSFNV